MIQLEKLEIRVGVSQQISLCRSHCVQEEEPFSLDFLAISNLENCIVYLSFYCSDALY